MTQMKREPRYTYIVLSLIHICKTMVVKAAEGLHMRPAGVIAREAGKFDSDVTIVFGDKRINAKSLGNLSLIHI